MASYPFFNEITTKSSTNGWFALSKLKVGGYRVGFPSFFHVSSISTFTPDPPTMIYVRIVPRIPISTTMGYHPLFNASSIGSTVDPP